MAKKLRPHVQEKSKTAVTKHSTVEAVRLDENRRSSRLQRNRVARNAATKDANANYYQAGVAWHTPRKVSR